MTEEALPELFVRKATGLVREAGPWSVIAVAGSFTIADGIHYFTAQVPYLFPGANMPIAYFAGVLIWLFPTIALAFLMFSMPRSSGDYVAVSRVVNPVLGYFEAWLSWIAIGISCGYVFFVCTRLFGAAFWMYGLAAKDVGFQNLGQYLSVNVEAAIVIGVAIALLGGIVNILGSKSWRFIVGAMFYIPLVGVALTCGAIAYGISLGPVGIQHAWDATWGAGAWNEIVDVAMKNGWAGWVAEKTGVPGAWGWPGGWTGGATVAALLPAAYTGYGLGHATYIAGEVSRPKRSYAIGTAALIAIVIVMYLVYVTGTLTIYGEFWSQYDYVMMGGFADQLKINPQFTPVITLFTMTPIASFSPWLALIIAATGALWLLNNAPCLILLMSRITFAFSFDRFFPEFFATVNDRFHSPHWSITLAVFSSIVGTFLFAYSPWFGMLNFLTAFIWRELLACWACMMIAYTKPDIWERGYAGRIGGVPITTIVGIIGTVAMTFLLLQSIMSMAGDVTSWIAQTFAWCIGPVLFVIYWEYNKRRGIDPTRIWAEVPPT